MTEQEYFEKIEKINKIIKKDMDAETVKKARKEIEKLKLFLPIRLELFLTETKLAYYSKAFDDKAIADMMTGKYIETYGYPGLENLHEFYKTFSDETGRFSEKDRHQYYIDRIIKAETKKRIVSDAVFSAFDDSDFAQILNDLSGEDERLAFFLLQEYCDKANISIDEKTRCDYIRNESNTGFLLESLNEENEDVWVLIRSEENLLSMKAIEFVLKQYKKKVVNIKPPVWIEKNDLNENILTQISIERMENVDGTIEYTPFLSKTQEGYNSSLFMLLAYLNSHYCNNSICHVLASGNTIDLIASVGLGKQKMFRLTNRTSETLEDETAYGIYGDYLVYISRIYKMDCKRIIEEESKVKFSIVIPARNSSKTLLYTLKTCLEQRYNGDYEIVVSDNSTEGNTDVYDTIKKLNDSRLVYVKTPRNLHLPRSFEFAFLQAKGEYIIPIGSDDGILPWTLEVLDMITDKFPQDEVIQWERGFYAWPGFNGGQENQFSIPRKYEKGKIQGNYIKATDYLEAVMENPASMYSLPLLYINSCFRRSYFKTLLDRTGCLWNGICQDLYMGIITAAIHPKIMLLQYPLTIAGMSASSEGVRANKEVMSAEEGEKIIQRYQSDGNVGGYCKTWYEQLSPDTGSDISSLYLSLLRAVNIGVLPEQYLESYFDFKKMFINVCRNMSVRDIFFDRRIHEIRYAAMQHGEEFLKWFDDAVYSQAFTPIEYPDVEKKQKRTYKVGTDQYGGQTLDASEYGVTNIYEASLLFAERTGL